MNHFYQLSPIIVRFVMGTIEFTDALNTPDFKYGGIAGLDVIKEALLKDGTALQKKDYRVNID